MRALDPSFSSRGEGDMSRWPRTDVRFWASVDRSGGPATCWEWMGRRNRKGYGASSIGTRGRPGFELGAHRSGLGSLQWANPCWDARLPSV